MTHDQFQKIRDGYDQAELEIEKACSDASKMMSYTRFPNHWPLMERGGCVEPYLLEKMKNMAICFLDACRGVRSESDTQGVINIAKKCKEEILIVLDDIAQNPDLYPNYGKDQKLLLEANTRI